MIPLESFLTDHHIPPTTPLFSPLLAAWFCRSVSVKNIKHGQDSREPGPCRCPLATYRTKDTRKPLAQRRTQRKRKREVVRVNARIVEGNQPGIRERLGGELPRRAKYYFTLLPRPYGLSPITP